MMWGIIFVTLVVGTILFFSSFSFSLSFVFVFVLFFVLAEVWVGGGLESSCFISRGFDRLSAIHSFSFDLVKFLSFLRVGFIFC